MGTTCSGRYLVMDVPHPAFPGPGHSVDGDLHANPDLGKMGPGRHGPTAGLRQPAGPRLPPPWLRAKKRLGEKQAPER